VRGAWNWSFSQNAYEVAENADALVIVTEWNEFKSLDMHQTAHHPVLMMAAISTRRLKRPASRDVAGRAQPDPVLPSVIVNTQPLSGKRANNG
jgi:hypothetical protein